ncbi:hypothetical protein BAC2_00497 [uncultured bacterium]|nr:hypothetical protein BAC2_00497 [uncultured bacterium]
MKFRVIEPEVAGGQGKDALMDRRKHPPVVSRLHYEFDGWLGDVLLETFPCFIVTKVARDSIEKLRLTGVEFDNVIVSVSEQFADLYPNTSLPEFSWAKVVGRAGRDDFRLAADHRLVVSDRALQLLRSLGLANAVVADFA